MRSFSTATPTANTVSTPADMLEQMGVKMTFARDEEIYAQEEDADLVYKVVSGAVRTTRLLADGRRQVGDFYFAGEYFGLESGDLHRFSAEALCDSVILVVKRSVAERDPQMERALWSATVNELDRTHEHLLLLGRKNACERVASFLADMGRRQNSQIVFLPMGRQDMADYLGLTIETVSRMLTQLKTSAVIRLEDSRHVNVRNAGAIERLCA